MTLSSNLPSPPDSREPNTRFYQRWATKCKNLYNFARENPKKAAKYSTIGITILTIIILAFTIFRIWIFSILFDILQWVSSLGTWAYFVMIGLIIISGIPLVQGYSVLLFACGFLFRNFWGWLAAFCGSNIGAIFGFSLARIFEEWFKERIQKHESLKTISDEVSENAYKFIILLRLSPISYSVLNGLFGISTMPIQKFIPANFIGVLPETALLVSIGASLGSLSEVVAGSSSNDPVSNGILIGQIIFLILVMFLLSYLVKRAMVKARTRRNSLEEPIEEPGSQYTHPDALDPRYRSSTPQTPPSIVESSSRSSLDSDSGSSPVSFLAPIPPLPSNS